MEINFVWDNETLNYVRQLRHKKLYAPTFNLAGKELSFDEMRSLRSVEINLIPRGDHQKLAAEELKRKLNSVGVVNAIKSLSDKALAKIESEAYAEYKP